MPERHFTIQGSDVGFVGGSYKASTPYNAGKKAGRILFQMIDHGAKYNSDKSKYAKWAKFASYAKYSKAKTIKFILRETTRDSAKKTFYYEVAQNVLSEPIIINRNGVEVTITKELSIKSCSPPHTH